MGRPKRDENGKVTESGFRIRRRILPSGAEVFQVDLGTVDGKRRRQQFTTITAARNHCRHLATDKERVGLAAFALSDRDREDAIQALRILAGTGATLAAAARAFRGKFGPPETSATFQAVCDDFLEWMRTTPRKLAARSPGQYRPATITDVAAKLSRLCRDLGQTPAVAVTAEELAAWLDAQAFHPTSWDNHRRAVGMLYTWATRDKGPLQGAANPAAAMKPEALAQRLPVILTPEAVENVLRFVESKAPGLVAYFATGFFAGLRPDELRRITPEALDFDAGEIRVPAEASKTHRERLVTMPANLRAWLAKYPPADGKTLGPSYSALGRFRRTIREALGMDWPKDIARHCFATYHAAAHGMDATAEQLGHGSTAMLHKHYKGLARNRATAAARYFAIQPATAEGATQWQLLSKPA
jgi:integrase